MATPPETTTTIPPDFHPGNLLVPIMVLAELPWHSYDAAQDLFPPFLLGTSVYGPGTADPVGRSYHVLAREAPLPKEYTMLPIGIHLIPSLSGWNIALPEDLFTELESG